MAPTPKEPRSVEPVDLLLCAGIVFFTLLLVAISKWSPNDGQTFQLVAGLVTGFSAAFLARLNPTKPKDPQ